MRASRMRRGALPGRKPGILTSRAIRRNAASSAFSNSSSSTSTESLTLLPSRGSTTAFIGRADCTGHRRPSRCLPAGGRLGRPASPDPCATVSSMAHPDDGRRLVAGRGLTARAVTALTPMMADVGFDRLAEVKGLLKRFFSDQGWGPADDDALARSVGAGEGTLREELAAGLWLIAGWEDGRFRLTVEADEAGGVAADEADEAGG